MVINAVLTLVLSVLSGKSTAASLLMRFYDPQEGQVLLDGVDIKTMNTRWVRSQIGKQEFFVFVIVVSYCFCAKATSVKSLVCFLEPFLRILRTVWIGTCHPI